MNKRKIKTSLITTVLIVPIGLYFLLPYECRASFQNRNLLLLGDLQTLVEKAQNTDKGILGISSADIYAKIKAIADRSVKENRPFFESKGSKRAGVGARDFMRQLISVAFIYTMTEQERYLIRAKKLIQDMIKWKKWNHVYKDPEKNSLDRNAIVISLSLAYNWLGEEMTYKERKIFRKAIIKKGIMQIYRAREKKKWPFSLASNNNHFIAGVAALGIGSLAVLEDEPKAERSLTGAISAAKEFISSSGGADGGYPESVLYGSFSLKLLHLFNTALTQTRKLDIHDYDTKAWLQKFNTYIMYSFFPDASSVVLFNDQLPSVGEIADQLIRCTSLYDGTEMAQNCQRQLKLLVENNPRAIQPSVYTFLYINPTGPQSLSYKLPKAKVFRTVGQAFYHEDWDNPNSLFLAFKAATHRKDSFWTNIAHIHYDAGQFVVYKNGNEYITDLGYQIGAAWANYSVDSELNVNELSRNSLSHSNMLFDGTPQDTLEAKISSYEHKDRLLYLQMDLARAYSKVDLDEYTREFILVDGDLFTIDKFRGSRIARFNYRLPITHRSIDRLVSNKLSIDNKTFHIVPYRGKEILRGSILYPNTAQIKEDNITFKAKGKKRSMRFVDIEDNLHNGTNFLINALSFSHRQYKLEDKGDFFLISNGRQKIYVAKERESNIIDEVEGINFRGRVVIIDSQGQVHKIL